MNIREHVFTLGRCVFCGAKDVALLAAEWQASRIGHSGEPEPDTRQCLPREDGLSARGMRPEPARRQIACEDADAIQAALSTIRAAEQPQCPRGNGMSLYNCLRTGGRCPAECPAYADWIGPDDHPAVAFAAGAFC